MCSEKAVLVFGPESTGSAATSNDIAVITSEHLDDPFKRVLTIIKAQSTTGPVVMGIERVFFPDKHVTLNPKFFIQSATTVAGTLPVTMSATNGFNSTTLNFGVTIKEIVEKLEITRVGLFTFIEGTIYEFEKTDPVKTRRVLTDTIGAKISGPVYTMDTTGTTKSSDVTIAKVWGRGDLLGTLTCKGGLIENGEAVNTTIALGDVSSEDTIADS
jgi:hypothetical protein